VRSDVRTEDRSHLFGPEGQSPPAERFEVGSTSECGLNSEKKTRAAPRLEGDGALLLEHQAYNIGCKPRSTLSILTKGAWASRNALGPPIVEPVQVIID
jgi:hypothetical protein